MSTTGKYAKMTQDDFDSIIVALVDRMTASQIVQIPGVYEILAEELNDDVLNEWESAHPSEPNDRSESPDAPQIGDLIFDPEIASMALPSPYWQVLTVEGQDPDDDQVWLVNGDMRIVWEDSAWQIAYDKEG